MNKIEMVNLSFLKRQLPKLFDNRFQKILGNWPSTFPKLSVVMFPTKKEEQNENNKTNIEKYKNNFFARLNDNDFAGINEKEIVDHLVNVFVDEAIPHSWNTSHPMDKCCLDNLGRVLDKKKLSKYMQTKNMPNLKKLMGMRMGRDNKDSKARFSLKRGMLFLLITCLLGGFIIFPIGEYSIKIKLPDNFSNWKGNIEAHNYGGVCGYEKLNSKTLMYTLECGKVNIWPITNIQIDGYEPLYLKSLQKEASGVYQLPEQTKWHVHFSENEALPFNGNHSVKFFNNENDCKTDKFDTDTNWWLSYEKPDLSNLPTVENKPEWARVFKGKIALSDCAETKAYSGEQKSLTFFFQSNKILGKRKIVVIAPSLEIANEGFGRTIQDTLKNWLVDIKQNIETQPTVPVTILWIDTEGLVHILIRSEDLVTDKSIAAAVNRNITFISNNFRSLRDLQPINQKLQKENFDQVLYLTDSADLAGKTRIPDSWLGVPLSWNNRGIHLSVLTINNCELWQNDAKIKNCQTLNRENAGQIFRNMLDELLQQ